MATSIRTEIRFMFYETQLWASLNSSAPILGTSLLMTVQLTALSKSSKARRGHVADQYKCKN